MPIESTEQKDQGQKIVSKIVTRPRIRTMGKDRIALEKGENLKSLPETEAAPPSDLPIAKEIKEEKEVFSWKEMITGHPRVLLIGFTSLLIIVGIGGFFYWKRYLAPESSVVATHYECSNYACIEIEGEGSHQCLSNEDCEVPEPSIPLPLISVGDTTIIEVDFENVTSFAEELEEKLSQEQENGSFYQVLLKQTSPEEKEYAKLEVLAEGLGIKLADAVYQSKVVSFNEGEDYTLLSYAQEEGNRLVLIVKLEEALLLEELNSQLSDWEETMVADLSALLLSEGLPEPATKEFQDNLYETRAIRYVNFPEPDLSIDYLIIGDKLIIATSRESTYAVIDQINMEIGENAYGQDSY